MVKAVPDILSQIVEHKKADLRREPDVERRAEEAIQGRRDFRSALLSAGPSVIAEIKKASPSQGIFAADFSPAAIARAYERGGAAALSVLTDQRHFQGKLADLTEARAAVRLPALRKDFTIDEYHVLEAAAHGADAILLIAAILDAGRLRHFRELAGQFAMTAIVEVHDEDELALALDSGATAIGVNNRDLRTFEVSLATALRLAPLIPGGVLKIAESGIRSAADRRNLEAAGYRAFLVGEHLMRAPDPEQALNALLA